METTRPRFGSVLEWLVAAGIIAAALAVGSTLVREFRTVRAVTPVMAGEAAPPQAPVGIPPGSVSVPMLLLVDGKEIRVGDRLNDAAAILGAESQLGGESVERDGIRERLMRFYDYAGSRFVLVFEPKERNAEPRVAAIYLQ